MESFTRMHTIVFLCLLALAMPASAGQAPNEASAWMRARIALDADGKLDSIEWLNTKPGDRIITARLEDVVRRWEFEPGSVNGVPAATETGLMIYVTVKPDDEGGMAVNIGRALTGATSLLQDPPRYPINEARNGNQAVLELQVDTDGAGNVVSAKVVGFEGSSNSRYSRNNFEKYALEIARTWTFHTEQVGGIGRPASMRVPVSFCMDAWCGRKQDELASRKKLAAEVPAPANMAVALSSAVNIKTRTAEGDI